jgi:hypothetical protein
MKRFERSNVHFYCNISINFQTVSGFWDTKVKTCYLECRGNISLIEKK